jgi:hypothetical protein
MCCFFTALRLVFRLVRLTFVFLLFAAFEVALNSLRIWAEFRQKLPWYVTANSAPAFALLQGFHETTFVPSLSLWGIVVLLRALGLFKLRDRVPNLYTGIVAITAGGVAMMATGMGCKSWCSVGRPGVALLPDLAESIEAVCSHCFAFGIGVCALALGRSRRPRSPPPSSSALPTVAPSAPAAAAERGGYYSDDDSGSDDD